MRHRYTEEQIDFLSSHMELSSSDLAILFNEKFNAQITPKAARNVLLRRGYRLKPMVRDFTDEQTRFIIDNFNQMKGEEFICLFNKKFNTNFSIHTIRRFANKEFGLKKGQGSFRKVVNEQDVVIRQGGRRKRKLVALGNGGGRHKYISLERFIYEQHHKVDTTGKHIIHLDGDIDNFDINNLYCLTNSEMALTKMLLGNKLIINRNRDVTITAIKLAKLMLKVKETKNA